MALMTLFGYPHPTPVYLSKFLFFVMCNAMILFEYVLVLPCIPPKYIEIIEGHSFVSKKLSQS